MDVSQHRQVIVVGAGMAGLVAARRLADRGLDVMVVEARDRVGGRLWSHRLPNDEVVELGGEWISTAQKAVMGLAGELHLGLVDTGMDFISRDPLDGPPIPVEEHERLATLLAARMSEIGPEALSSMSAATLLEGLGESGPAMDVLCSRLEGTAGASLHLMAAAEIGEEFGIGDEGSYVRVEGGNDRLARELTHGLDVQVGRKVTSIRQTGDSVSVQTGDEAVTASAVVLAVPLGVLKWLSFDPGLPGETAAVLDALGMGNRGQGGIGDCGFAADVPQTGFRYPGLVLDRPRAFRFGETSRDRIRRLAARGECPDLRADDATGESIAGDPSRR